MRRAVGINYNYKRSSILFSPEVWIKIFAYLPYCYSKIFNILKCYLCSIALRGAEISTVLKVDQKYLTNSREEWRSSVDPIVWKSITKNQEGQEYKHEINRRMADWIGRILRRNCLIKHVTEGNIEGYTGCHRRKGPNFGMVFLMLNYTDITQNTYIQSWTVTEIMAREKCGHLAFPRNVRLHL